MSYYEHSYAQRSHVEMMLDYLSIMLQVCLLRFLAVSTFLPIMLISWICIMPI